MPVQGGDQGVLFVSETIRSRGQARERPPATVLGSERVQVSDRLLNLPGASEQGSAAQAPLLGGHDRAPPFDGARRGRGDVFAGSVRRIGFVRAVGVSEAGSWAKSVTNVAARSSRAV